LLGLRYGAAITSTGSGSFTASGTISSEL
jgi:hypothetical protein